MFFFKISVFINVSGLRELFGQQRWKLTWVMQK